MNDTKERINKMLKKSEVILNAGKPKHNDIKVPPFTDGQKEVIEAVEKHKEKCKEIEIKINKYGHKNICDVDGIDDDITDIKELMNDTISRIENPTNEDWFCGLPTEEKAKWLFNLTYKCYWCGREYTPRSPSLFNEKECPFKKCMKDKKDFKKWLKQPHRNE